MESLPVPDQLIKQLDKCKSVRGVDHYKSRTRSSQEMEALKAKLPPIPGKSTN